MWKGRFSEETSEAVLQFTQSLDLDWGLARYDIAGSIAHARMLASVGLLSQDEGDQLVEGLKAVDAEVAEGKLEPSVDLEDVHMNIEHRLTEVLGDLGAKLHTGRSRNDQVATTMRLFMKDQLYSLGCAFAELQNVLLQKAMEHRDVIVPGYTHLQQAQPISLGHYWLAHFQALRRDGERLIFALNSADESPLGAGALAGSTLPLDRHFSANALGFSRVSENSLDTVAQRDYLMDFHYFASLFAIHCSRLAEDLVIYSSQEFGWLLLPDAFCTGSSMMPQKKNPDVLELIRGKTGQVVGHLVDLMITVKGLPMTYDRDMQEDKRGVMASLQVIHGVLTVLPELLARVDVDAKRAVAGFESGFALATDVAEYLVTRGVPFREAHWKVGRLVQWCIAEDRKLTELSIEEWRKHVPEVEEHLLSVLSLSAAVRRRDTYGGTSPKQVDRQIERGQKELKGFMDRLQPFNSVVMGN